MVYEAVLLLNAAKGFRFFSWVFIVCNSALHESSAESIQAALLTI